MTTLRVLTFGCVLAVLSIFFTSVRAETPLQYSAEQTIHATGMTMKAKMFFDQGKMRIEQDQGGMVMTTIIRPDKNLIYQIMPGNMYMEIPIPPTGASSVNPLANSAASPDPTLLIGSETINGVACEKYRMNAGQPGEAVLWLAQDTKLPVKMELADKTSWIEWSGMTPGPQKPELFEVPAGAQKLDVGSMPDMSKMLSNMPKQ